jgi:hypothetical protein
LIRAGDHREEGEDHHHGSDDGNGHVYDRNCSDRDDDVDASAHAHRYQREMMGLFDKYKCYPFRSFAGPFANLAIFVPMFFGLRKAGEYIPGE